MKKMSKCLLITLIVSIFFVLTSCGSIEDSSNNSKVIESSSVAIPSSTIESSQEEASSTIESSSVALPSSSELESSSTTSSGNVSSSKEALFYISVTSEDETMGSVEPLTSNIAKLNDVITITATPKEEYNFFGWYDISKDEIVSNSPTIDVTVKSDISYVAKFKAKVMADYTVNIYLENSNGGYSLSSDYSYTSKAEVNKSLTITPLSIKGFETESSAQTKTITKNESNVFTFWYERIGYNVELKSNIENENITITGAGTYKYGDEVTISASIADTENLAFKGWYETKYNIIVSYDATYNFEIKSDINYTAVFEEVEYADYTVNVLLENTTDGNYVYDQDLSYTSKGIVGLFTLKANEITGFKTPDDVTDLIYSDGSSEFYLYYDRLKYDVSLSSNINSPLISVTGSGKFKYGSDVTISTSCANQEYIFVHWFDMKKGEVISTDSKYTFTLTSDVNYSAIYKEADKSDYNVNIYFQNIDDNNYTLSTNYSYKAKGYTNQYVVVYAIPFDGFDTPMSMSRQIKDDGTTTYDFYYNRLSYSLDLSTNNDNDEITISGAGTYKYGEEVTISASFPDLFGFDGWYDGENCVSTGSTYKFKMSSSNTSLVAKISQVKFKLTYESLIPGILIDYSKEEYVVKGSKVGLYQNNGTSNDFLLDWVRDDNVSYNGKYYEFEMPSYDLHIKLTTDQKYFTNKAGDEYYFGAYPQLTVTKTKIIDKLNSIAGVPHDSNLTWISYGYYEDSTVSDSMYYIDIDIDNNGINDYRGVYLYNYRPSRTQNSVDSTDLNIIDQDDSFDLNTVYWFKYSVITWGLNNSSDNTLELYSMLILDSQDYNHYYDISGDSIPYEHNGGTGYANSYPLSDIRKWLNTTFYNTAFSSEQKAIMKLVSVESNEGTTNDCVYLFSVDNTLGDNTSATTYACCQGHKYGYWTLTSSSYGKKAVVVSGALGTHYYLSDTYVGVRPIITISI